MLKIMTCVLFALLLTGCEPARIASPIEQPVAASFPQQEVSEALLKTWMSKDDPKALAVLLANTKKISSEVFHDAKQWPDCDGILELGKLSLDSNTVYGLSIAPTYQQQAIVMGCPSFKSQANEYRILLNKALNERNVQASKEHVDLVATYLDFVAHKQDQTCLAQGMKIAREQNQTLLSATAAVKKSCAGPPR